MPHQPLRPPFRPRCLSSERRKEVVGEDVSGVLTSPSCSQQPPVRLVHGVSKGLRPAEELEVRGLGMGAAVILRVLGTLRVLRKPAHPCSPTSPFLSWFCFLRP